MKATEDTQMHLGYFSQTENETLDLACPPRRPFSHTIPRTESVCESEWVSVSVCLFVFALRLTGNHRRVPAQSSWNDPPKTQLKLHTPIFFFSPCLRATLPQQQQRALSCFYLFYLKK